jgi:hypothetical protein
MVCRKTKALALAVSPSFHETKFASDCASK